MNISEKGRNMFYDKGYEKCAYLYDIFDNKENFEFFYHYASEIEEILDIGAGTGRIAIHLAKKGIVVFCVEPSPAMRREFLRKLSLNPEISEKITLMGGDTASFDFGRMFSSVFLSGVFDHFLDDEERLTSLSNINKHLKPGGKLIFDVFLGLMKDSPISPAGVYKIGDKEYRRFVGGKVLPGNIKETMLIFETYEHGKLVKRIREKSLVGLTDQENVHNLLKASGFEIEREFSNYDFTSFRKGDSLLLVEAKKE
jgi:SAM-dependent methyltransferase